MKMKKIISAIALLVVLFTSSCNDDHVDYTIENISLSKKLQSVFDGVKSDPSLYSASLSVIIPDRDFKFKAAYGNATPTQVMLPDDQFFSASIGKMVTSVIIMKLLDEGKLGLDDAISKYLATNITDGLHVFNKVDYSKQITIRQLLNHTSGLPDFLLAGVPDANGLSPFFQALFSNVEHTWTAVELINFHKQNFQPIAKPGDVFEYSDTNYQLLGLIIESITSKKLHEYAYEKIFQPFGMSHSYYFFHELERGNAIGRTASWSYISDIPINFPGMSFDWAAGGLITTSEDLLKFLKQAVSGNYLSTKSKAAMQTFVTTKAGYDYGLGMMRITYGPGSDNYIIGHEGATNAVAFYLPQYNAYIIGTLNQVYSTTVTITDLLFNCIQVLPTN
jgi:D-alanyl-D-alanine carboxypeptidase